MTYKPKYFAIIPARKGSKGIKNKNLIKISNKPLVTIAIDIALKAKIFDKIILSSDSNKILNIAKRNKIILDKRPKKLSTKFSPSIDTIKYLIKKYNIHLNDFIFILEPTSPLRNIKDILKAKKLLTNKKIDTVCSFTTSWTNPYRTWKKNHSKMINYTSVGKKFLPRQQLPNFYQATGHIIAFKLKKKLKSILSNNLNFIMVEKERAIDIDNLLDYKICKLIYEKKL